MYLFSQNVSRILFYFIKNKIKVVENVAIFNMNIWAVHHIDSLIPMLKSKFSRIILPIWTFLVKNKKNRNCSQVLKKLWKFRSWDLETCEIMWWAFTNCCHKNNDYFVWKKWCKKQQYVQLIVLGIGWLF